MVVKFTIKTRATKLFITPPTDVINAVRLYNQIRVDKAKYLSTLIKDGDFINKLRKSSKIDLLNTSPDSTKCVISNSLLSPETGKTLLMHSPNDDIVMCCIHQRFVEYVNKYYNIAHFDDEIFKTFKKWYLQKYRSLDTIDHEKMDTVSNEFTTYNSGSKVNLLYIKFNTICDL
tara:strand:- start:798 stop:1319 length:522 start_codon:yes stop_codon:yes gene_type:complete